MPLTPAISVHITVAIAAVLLGPFAIWARKSQTVRPRLHRSEHALGAEFDRLRYYLELMAIRMGPWLDCTLSLPAQLAAHPVPPLILQSLVENAIIHGLEPQVAGG